MHRNQSQPINSINFRFKTIHSEEQGVGLQVLAVLINFVDEILMMDELTTSPAFFCSFSLSDTSTTIFINIITKGPRFLGVVLPILCTFSFGPLLTHRSREELCKWHNGTESLLGQLSVLPGRLPAILGQGMAELCVVVGYVLHAMASTLFATVNRCTVNTSTVDVLSISTEILFLYTLKFSPHRMPVIVFLLVTTHDPLYTSIWSGHPRQTNKNVAHYSKCLFQQCDMQ